MASQDDKECSDDENDEHDTQGHKGYCHFNENGSHNTFMINVFGTDITINQKPDAINLGHGAVVWDAAVVFCKYLEHNSSIYSVAYLKDKKILELGAGCGLSGLTTMMKGAIVTLTDLQCVVDTLLSQNAEVQFLNI